MPKEKIACHTIGDEVFRSLNFSGGCSFRFWLFVVNGGCWGTRKKLHLPITIYTMSRSNPRGTTMSNYQWFSIGETFNPMLKNWVKNLVLKSKKHVSYSNFSLIIFAFNNSRPLQRNFLP